ncbi:efflux RND transporter periplasmic adaptor subunit (plasmid) [Limimaricola variabilis]|uniref:efflux RND transporter periplasmic adaptor subunit n=1 Tax=Limimaricola variabilis TaxID=1492771 RepID=UPI002AC899C5|nr:efflux RND transporter periplasmic adaptor subunit [Limimaricola variabilis]WPY96327.1 efflux RND transporter periplasmic adaptor subunit [Limimaricola variabilis]
MTRLLPFLAALTLLASQGAAQQAATDAAPRPVKLMVLGAEDTALTREFYGQVAARQTVDLAFQIGGQLVEFPVLEGQIIPAGDLVARLDPEPFELALEEAELRQAQAARDLDRLNQLSRSTVSEASQEEARTNAELARVAQRDAERALSKARLDAPFEALVAERLVANFTTVGAGTPIVRLHDMSELRVEVEVPEILFQRAGRDPDVEITARFPGLAESFPLVIREFTSDATAVGQSFGLTLAFEAESAPDVLPGSSVTVTARLDGAIGGLPVPPTALVGDLDGTVEVMVFEPGDSPDRGRVLAREVEIEIADDGGFLVTGGVERGAEIVAAGAAALEDGQAVRRFAGFPQ